MNSVKLILKKIQDLVNEIEVYEFYKEKLIDSLAKVNDDYLKGKIDFITYEKQLIKILGKKSKKELIHYYNSYIYYLLKKVEFYNSQVFYIAYHDSLYKNLGLPKKVEEQVKSVQKYKILFAKNNLKAPAVHDVSVFEILGRRFKSFSDDIKKSGFSESVDKFLKSFKKSSSDVKVNKTLKKKFVNSNANILENKLEAESKLLHESVYDSEFERKLESELNKDALKKNKLSKKPFDKESEVAKRSFDSVYEANSVYDKIKDDFDKLIPKPMELDTPLDVPSPVTHTILNFFASSFEFLKVKLGFKKEVNSVYNDLKDLGLPDKGEVSSIISNVKKKEGRINKALKNSETASYYEEEVIGDETKIGSSLLSMVSKSKRSDRKNDDFSDNALMKEAKHMRKLLESQQKDLEQEKSFWKKYNLIERLLNIHVKKFSLYLIESFPGLFKNLYEYLRFADIKMLSNTYVNLMIFLTIATFVVTFPLALIFNFLKGLYPGMVFLNSLFFALISSVVVFFGIYHYPSFRIKAIRRSINSNLPFAINHMTAIASSGVPPTTMFKLIAMSDEYGEVSKEIRKVSDYITVFGYDVLTAVKQVSSTVPARSLKEFLDGFVSTVEAGGDLVDYLKQKSDESMMSYNLERQKYNETIGTYSDIYTGIMVAAPLFFMSTLSIINLLGGKVGQINVNTLLGNAIYFIMPLINIGFLIFVHFNQPEV